jgi:uroporphyrinogen decarboxylase
MLRACRGEPVDRPPVWLMRQAGRYLPEYRALRKGIGFLDMCRDVERAVEASLQPIRLVGSEAVVFFCDIFVPVLGLGVELDFAPGPVIETPLRTRAQLDALTLRDPRETVPYVFEILGRLRGALAQDQIPLIGFAGAPFTLATYLVEGKGDPSRQFPHLMGLVRDEPALVEQLLETLTEMTLAYLRAQIEAGAQVVQLFDTWAGVLTPEQYAHWVLPGIRRIAAGLEAHGTPLILYLNDAPHQANCANFIIIATKQRPSSSKRILRNARLARRTRAQQIENHPSNRSRIPHVRVAIMLPVLCHDVGA